jgi:phosphatase NudJ
MARDPIPTWFFVLTVVRRHGTYLLVHELKHGQRWYLPAGRVEPGEALVAAAERETLEESGVPIRVTGLIRVEFSPDAEGTRVRVILAGEPVDDTPPKSQPDAESLAAGWFSARSALALPLRGYDVADVIEYLEAGGSVAPLSVLTWEGAPYA